MAQNLLFSRYSQGENRVTAAVMAVLERLPFDLVQRILQQVLGEPETDLVVFENQVRTAESVPDARIAGSFEYWIETKVATGAVRVEQLRKHLAALDAKGHYRAQRLLVVTPDVERPAAMVELGDPRVVWTSFTDFSAVLRSTASGGHDWDEPGRPVATDRERELIAELVHFLKAEKLTESVDDQVLVVAARIAFDEYAKHGVYFCQPHRSFRRCSRIAFYREGHIQPVIPRVLEWVEEVHLDVETISQREDIPAESRDRLAKLAKQLLDEQSPRALKELKVLLLSRLDSPKTHKLSMPIANNLQDESGRTQAFVQGHRYVAWAKIKDSPRTTSQLL